ncbi:MAG: FAD-binding oxidoreductase [Syntrophorhabdales bacterium]|jgi:glycolate oxidase
MALSDREYQALEDIVGQDNISRDPAILDTYNQCWGHKAVFDQKWSPRAGAVLLPGSTEECQAIVKACNRYHIPFKPFSSGFEIVALALTSADRNILLDLKRMDRILEIDVKNMHAVVEPYVPVYRLQKELFKHGVTVGAIGAGPSTGIVAASCCHFGGGTTMVSTGGLGRGVLGVEWILPTGDILRMGSAENDHGWYSADGPGPNLRGVLRGRSGANGGHGVITKASVKLYPWYGPDDMEFAGPPGVSASARRITKVPENYKPIMIKFPTEEAMWQSLQRIGRAELATSLMAAMLFPYGEGNDEAWVEIQKIAQSGADMADLAETSIAILIGADTQRGLAYKEKCLMHIMNELGGFPLPLPPLGAEMMFAGLMWHFLFVQAAFRRTGDFFISPTGDASLGQMKLMHQRAKEIIMPYLRNGQFLQTPVPDMFAAPSEHNSVGIHEENCTYYDPWDQNSLNGMRELATMSEDPDGSCGELGVCHLGGGLQVEFASHVHQKFGPKYDNYDVWLRKIRAMLDPNDVGDWSAYIPSIFP